MRYIYRDGPRLVSPWTRWVTIVMRGIFSRASGLMAVLPSHCLVCLLFPLRSALFLSASGCVSESQNTVTQINRHCSDSRSSRAL